VRQYAELYEFHNGDLNDDDDDIIISNGDLTLALCDVTGCENWDQRPV
jgi:hypothetical protein